MSPIDYIKLSYYQKRHFQRLKLYIENMSVKLTCQECGGCGEYVEPCLDDGSGPYYTCGFCEGLGYVTNHRRGLWLKMRRNEKKHFLGKIYGQTSQTV